MPEELPKKRLRRWERPGDLRFITFSCYQRLPLLGHPAIRDLFVECLATAKARVPFELYAWVVMPEHVHLVLRPKRGWAATAASLKVSVAKRVIGRWRELDAPILKKLRVPDGGTRFWQRGGGFDRNVRNGVEVRRFIRYVHRNPVERGLADEPQMWRWSSARWWMGDRTGTVECDALPDAAKVRWEGFV